jgi:hypothetical protein
MIYRRIWRSYDTDEYTKVCGGGSYKRMKIDKVVKLFQTMAIVSLNTRNLTLKVNTLKNKLVMGEKEEAILQKELDKKKEFQKGYKHNVEI